MKSKQKIKKWIFHIFSDFFFHRLSVVKNSSNDDDSRSFATMKLECSIVLKNLSIDDESKSFAATNTVGFIHFNFIVKNLSNDTDSRSFVAIEIAVRASEVIR